MIEIVRLAPVDADRFRAIRLRSLKTDPTSFGSTYEETVARPPEAWTTQLRELATFVAVRDGADVGVARGISLRDEPDAAILLSMWVAPAARGQGVGDALVDAVAGWARREGHARLVLDVGNHNAHAIALYERKGFVPLAGAVAGQDPAVEHRRELWL